MALITCSECKKEVSQNAAVCPHCGNPIQGINQATEKSPVLIEQTSKKWKKVKLIAVLMLIVGLFIWFVGFGSNKGSGTSVSESFGILIAIIGFIVLLVGKFGAWWGHR